MADMHRPVYHFMPERHWMNDPNGLIWHEGFYHVFYQHNPGGDTWGDMHWGHARSPDLIHWERLPLALAPSPKHGELHCFSGCAVSGGEYPTLFYTSVGEGELGSKDGARQWRAQSRDGLLTWEKDEAPVLTDAVHDAHVSEWRDPFVWRDEAGQIAGGDTGGAGGAQGRWHMILGGSRDGRGVILRYSSDDLAAWRYDGVFFEDAGAETVECPNMLAFGDKWLLFYSPYRDVVWHTGHIDPSGRFVSEGRGILDHSGTGGFYAPAALGNDPKGRRLIWGWITENARGDYPIPGYCGALSVPREVTLSAQGQPIQAPAAELAALRRDKEHISGLHLSGDEIILKTGGRAVEIHLWADFSDADDFCLSLLETPDGKESTQIRYQASDRSLSLDKHQTSLDDRPLRDGRRVILSGPGERLELRILLDHSIIEVFAGREAFTARLYPTREDGTRIRLSGLLNRGEITAYTMGELSWC